MFVFPTNEIQYYGLLVLPTTNHYRSYQPPTIAGLTNHQPLQVLPTKNHCRSYQPLTITGQTNHQPLPLHLGLDQIKTVVPLIKFSLTEPHGQSLSKFTDRPQLHYHPQNHMVLSGKFGCPQSGMDKNTSKCLYIND